MNHIFLRIIEVCTKEFDLIARVFGEGDTNEEMILSATQMLLDRLVSDHSGGLQRRVSDLLILIDRRGDYEAYSKKLDLFMVLREKSATIFEILRDAKKC